MSGEARHMHLLDAPLVDKRRVSRDMWVLGFRAAAVAAEVRAGQFVNLGLGRGFLLRRPFSVYRAAGDRFEIVLKAVGTGTAALVDMEAGGRGSCLGPPGRPFHLAGGARTVGP